MYKYLVDSERVGIIQVAMVNPVDDHDEKKRTT